MYRRILPALAILPLAALACTPPAQDTTGSLEDRVALEQLHDRHVQAARDEDVDAFLATVTDDFVLMPPNDPGASGAENVRAWFEATFSAFDIGELEFPERDLTIDRTLALMHYTYDWTLVPDAGADTIRDRGDGLYVYERQGDGSWLVSHDIWTSSEPLPGSE